MVKAITHWDSLLLGHPFVVETDHKNLCFLYKSDNPKVVRWRTRLSEYKFEVHHIAGIDNPVADALVGYTQFKFPLPAKSMRCK